MIRFIIILATYCSFAYSSLYAQITNPEAGPVFTDTEVPSIYINLPQESIDAILDDVWSDDEYEAQFIFMSSEIQDTVENVGVRLRGNTSRASAKKSVKVSFNTFQPGRKFHGLEKLNINGEHNDPSIVRSKTSWDLSQWVGLPASRSNHVALYVNGDYLGLYTNVEHIDEVFVSKRFEDGSGNLWKCLYPANLKYLGFNPDLYKSESEGRRIYDLKTNKTQDDYSKLAHFIDVINNYEGESFKCEIERIFDVDNYIKSVVLEVLLSHWDGPTANMNNFYLYHDPCNDKIQFIPYDLDNTFGIDWSGRDWTEISIYDWSENSWDNGPRPMYNSIMAVPEYRSRFNHYMRFVIDNYFNESVLFPYLDEKLDLVKSFRENDTFAGLDYGWDYDDFLQSYELSIGDHVRKGMKEYVSQRVSNTMTELEQTSYSPIVQNIEINWTESLVEFNIQTYDDQLIDEVSFHYSFDGIDWNTESLTINQNNLATYQHTVSQEGMMLYYISVVDNDGNQRDFPLCQDAVERLGYLESPKLVINELMSSNNDFEADEFGEFDDWIELYNMSGTVLPIGKMHLSDNPEKPGKWKLPNTALSPNQFIIIWADEDSFQGNNHANFKLKKSGEDLGLYDEKANHYRAINLISIPELESNYSFARKPNGVGEFEITEKATFGFDNDLSSNVELSFTKLKIYPNPADQVIHIDTDIALESFQMYCIDTNGKTYPLSAKGNSISINSLENGVYTLMLRNEKLIHVKKFIVTK